MTAERTTNPSHKDSKIGCILLIALGVVLASMITPRPGHTRYSPMARAVSEIRNADLVFTKLLHDADVKDLHLLFSAPAALDGNSFQETLKNHTAACYDLLLHGRNAAGLKPEYTSKLADNYMLLKKDPWKHEYQFFIGPIQGAVNTYSFRSYRGEDYVYDRAAYEEAEKEIRGNLKPEADIPPGKGYPCPGDQSVYIFSLGQNGKPDQLPFGGSGGDDINNCDNESGWGEFY